MKNTEMLIQAFEFRDLWDSYDVVSDIIVHFFMHLFFLFTDFPFVAVHE